ncbi:hypothetical protein [Pseudomonas sp. Marseille-Q5115]|uniref:hypothetical protein n=1 Tax=Pseudomonas sp. Marseille-Q5115 TaxID=2866593 RepID=UPI001CE3D2F1|nr:hypothetical protein [Pseudomonas sp. Marseille-Q5115]
MATYIGWETSVSLLLAHETLAKNHLKMVHAGSEGGKDPEPYFMYKNTFALLILNASIVEGTLRSILTELVKADLNAAIDLGRQQGRTAHDAPTRVLQKFLADLEGGGSWSTLTASATLYLGAKLADGIDEGAQEGIEKLFVLRNVLAHGTTLIQPKTKMADDLKDEYPFNWQSKLHGVTMYLEKHLGRKGIFENLAHPDCPKHFIDVTKQYFTDLEAKCAPLPERVAKTIEMVKGYSFGYYNWHH